MGNIADLNMALNFFDMGKEKWSVWTQAFTPLNGTLPATLVSGMAKDADGRMKHLSVSSRIRYGQWEDLFHDPNRKKALLKELEEALGPER
jgi:hypothetical protein